MVTPQECRKLRFQFRRTAKLLSTHEPVPLFRLRPLRLCNEVVRAAIQNAASVAALLITTEAMIAELPKKSGAGGGGMPPGGGMGGMDF